MLDLHVHLIGHLDRQATEENIRSYLDQARKARIIQIGFTDHDIFWEELNLPLIREVSSDYPDLQVRIGLEVEYKAANEANIRSLTESFAFDYIIGSVHEIGNWAFDYPTEEENHYRQDSDEIYRDYFSLVEKAACSGLFDIIGHYDLIKIFGVRPRTDVRDLASRSLEAIKEHGLTVEINTNGRYKPVKEFYPEIKLIEQMIRMEIPLTLGSDAHEAGIVGRDLWEVCGLLKSMGIKEITGFKAKGKENFSL